MSPNNLIQINIDGGSRGNPGPAAYAFVVTQNDQATYRESNFLGSATNNIAEYTGLIKALEFLTGQTPSSVQISMDSLLIIQQVKGIYKVKQPHLQQLHLQVSDLLETLSKAGFSISINHVYRKHNSAPDSLLNECLDQHGKH